MCLVPSSFRNAGKFPSGELLELVACGFPSLDILIRDLERKASTRGSDD
jgi:hypothetical protein